MQVEPNLTKLCMITKQEVVFQVLVLIFCSDWAQKRHISQLKNQDRILATVEPLLIKRPPLGKWQVAA